MAFQVWKTSESSFLIFDSNKMSPFCFLKDHKVAVFTEDELRGLRDVLDCALDNKQVAIEVEAVEPVDLDNLKLSDNVASIIGELELMDVLTEVEAGKLKEVIASFSSRVITLEDLFSSLMYNKNESSDSRKEFYPNSSALATFLTRHPKLEERLLNFFCPVVIDYLKAHSEEEVNSLIADGKFVKTIPVVAHEWGRDEEIVFKTCGDLADSGFSYDESKERWSISLYTFRKHFIRHGPNLRLMVRIMFLVVSENLSSSE